MKAQQNSPSFEQPNQEEKEEGGQTMFNWDMLTKMAPALAKQQLAKLPEDQRQIFQALEVKFIKREDSITIEVDYKGDDERGPQAAANMLSTLSAQLPNMVTMFGCKVKFYD